MMHRISRREKAQRVRVRIAEILFALLMSAIIYKAYNLHINTSPRLKSWAKREYEKFVVLSPRRGEIFDRTGKHLASSVAVKSIYANPGKISGKKNVAEKLSRVLGLKRRTLVNKLKSQKHFVWLKRKVSPDVYKKIAELSIEGIGALEETNRFYPNIDLASNVIGFTGLDSYGLSGVELKYEKFLRSREARFTKLHDALGRTLYTDGFLVKQFSVGNSVYLTLDRTIQYISELELDSVMTKSGAKRGYVVMIEPSTGRILAMVSRPQFNPNNYGKSNPNTWMNGTVSLVYEPGSTFKVFVIASAIEEGIIYPDDLFLCKRGTFSVTGKTIRDSSDRGWLSPSSIIKYSSNIGAAKIAMTLGKQKLYDWVKRWGFGEFSGIDLPGETRGLLRNSSKWSPLDTATMGFGQGIAVSPVQLVTALSAIANGGLKVRPFVVEKVANSEGKEIFRNKVILGPRIVSKDTARMIRNFMIGVTDPDGTGSKARVSGFTVAGKTGTAQKVDRETGEYSNEKMISSFMGFVPALNPRIALLVVIDEPKGAYYGGEVAAPVFKRIASKTLKYLKVLPDTHDVRLMDEKTGSDPEIILVSDEKGTEFVPGAFPDFIGLGIRDVFRTAHELGIKVSIVGTGMAFKQVPQAGSRTDNRRECVVYFKPI